MIWAFNALFLGAIIQNLFFPVADTGIVLAFWQVALPMVAGALIGNEQVKEQEREQERVNKMNALETQYSPWIAPNYQQAPTPGSRLGAIGQGALSGYMLGSQFSGGGSGKMTTKDGGKTGMVDSQTMNQQQYKSSPWMQPRQQMYT